VNGKQVISVIEKRTHTYLVLVHPSTWVTPSLEYSPISNVSLFSGISRTQVIVIATCSAVLGTFFVVAGIMRIQ